MSLISALAATAAVAAGTAGAVTAYQLASPEPASAPAIETVDQGTGPDRPRFAPCKKPARLKDGRCVTNLSRTVVVPGSTVAASGGSGVPVAPGGENARSTDFSDDARRDLDDDELVAVEDDDGDDDWDDGTHTQTRTRSHADTGTHTSTGGGTSTRTRTGGSGSSG